MYTGLDSEESLIISWIMRMLVSNEIKINIKNVQKQKNSYDCGAFAIAFAFSLAFKKSPTTLTLNEEKLRSHIITCFKDKVIKPFPSESRRT